MSAPWYRVYYALEAFQESEPDTGCIKGAHLIFADLRDWIAEVRKDEPNSAVLVPAGRRIWTFWVKMLHWFLPVRPEDFHPDVVAAHKVPLFDKRKFAIGYAAHCALFHAPEWVRKWGPRFFSRAIETGGEHALYSHSLLLIQLSLRQGTPLFRAGALLFYAISHCVGKALRAAYVHRCSIHLADVSAKEVASRVWKAAINATDEQIASKRSLLQRQAANSVRAAKAAGCAARAVAHAQKMQVEDHSYEARRIVRRRKRVTAALSVRHDVSKEAQQLPAAAGERVRERAASGLRITAGPHARYKAIADLPVVSKADWARPRRIQPVEDIPDVAVPTPPSFPTYPMQEEVMLGLWPQLRGRPPFRGVRRRRAQLAVIVDEDENDPSGRASADTEENVSSLKTPTEGDIVRMIDCSSSDTVSSDSNTVSSDTVSE